MIAPLIVDGGGFKVRVEHQYGYLRAYVHEGEDSLAVSIAVWKLLAQLCTQHGARRLLVVEDLHGTVPHEDVAQVIDAMADFGFARIRTAFVELQSDIQGSELGEILASERGVTVHVARDEVAARHWLMYGE